MRSPLMVPLVLVMLMLPLLSGGEEDVLGFKSNSHHIADNSHMPSAHSPSVDKMDRTQSDYRVPQTGDHVVPHITDEKVLKAVESNLLSLFGLKNRPRPKQNIIIPESLKELYRRQTGLEVETTNFHLPGSHTGSANTVRTFTHQESTVDDQFGNPHRFRLSFTIDAIPKSEHLQAAELQLSAIGAHHILVHDIVRPGVRGQRQPILRLIDSKSVTATNDFIKLDVTPAVKRWLAGNATDNHGLLVVVKPNKGGGGRVRLKRHITDESSEWHAVQPVLYTYTDDGKQKSTVPLAKRERRAVRKHRRKDGRDLCRRHDMFVDFTEVGWNDWIVAPAGYDAYYCAGDCPFPQADHLNSTNHAIVQTMVNNVFPGTTPKACCVPTSLTSISMLYVENDNSVVLKNYHDMSIIGCGCR